MGIGPSVHEQEVMSKCTTPPPITRILPKKLDPRSPTEGITRTPIEVACTPKIGDEIKIAGSNLEFETPKSCKCENNFTIDETHVKISDINCVEQESKVTLSGKDFIIHKPKDDSINETNSGAKLNEMKFCDGRVFNCDKNEDYVNMIVTDKDEVKYVDITPLKKKPVYFETDIDAIDDSFTNNFHIEHPRVKQLKMKKDANKIALTEAAQNGNLPEDPMSEAVCCDSLATKIYSMSFDDISLMVSDDDVSLTADHKGVSKHRVQDWLITIEDDCHGLVPFDIPVVDSAENTKINDNENNSDCGSVKNVYFTPDNKRNMFNAERTPLSCLVQNKISNPVKMGSSLKKKHWSGIEEERQRRGILLDNENTPPHPPPLDKVSSAPGKLMVKRRNIEWNKDNGSVLI